MAVFQCWGVCVCDFRGLIQHCTCFPAWTRWHHPLSLRVWDVALIFIPEPWPYAELEPHTFKAYCAANCYLCYQQGVCASVFFGFTLDELGSIKIYSWSTVLHAWALSSVTAWMQMMRISWGLASVIITVAFTLGLRIFQNPWHGKLCLRVFVLWMWIITKKFTKVWEKKKKSRQACSL